MDQSSSTTSIVIPCKNEQGNLPGLLVSIIAHLKHGDEIIIVEGGSEDDTWLAAKQLEKQYPNKVRAIKQGGKGKFNAVIAGIDASNCKQIMIWDADGTVNLDQNIQIYLYQESDEVLVTGNRLTGTRDKDSMRFANLIGNWAFALLWGYLLQQRPIDMLCGTKKFPKRILTQASYSILHADPFGDFTIVAMARRLNMKIVSIPVHYHARSYGKTNIRRWKGGFQLLFLTARLSKFLRS